jgi:hypothetical protein
MNLSLFNKNRINDSLNNYANNSIQNHLNGMTLNQFGLYSFLHLLKVSPKIILIIISFI